MRVRLAPRVQQLLTPSKNIYCNLNKYVPTTSKMLSPTQFERRSHVFVLHKIPNRLIKVDSPSRSWA